MKVSLVMFSPKGERRAFRVHGPTAIIGRTGEVDLQIQLGIISRRHCELTQEGNNLSVRDLGSSNGTFVNGERVQMQVLKPGDQLMVGPVIFTVVIDGTPAEITPIKTVLNGHKKKKKKNDESGEKEGSSLAGLIRPAAVAPKPAPKAPNPADSGSMDLAPSDSGLAMMGDEESDDDSHNPLAALEELSKQQKR